MKQIKLLCAIAALGSALAAWPATAQEEMPEVMTMNGVSYTSGGIGEGERSAMMQSAKNYNLRLTFTVRNGAYLADVNVGIRDAKGHSVLDAVSNGPWFYAKLPPGKYKVTGEANGKTMTRMVSVGKSKGAVVNMSWPGEAERAN